MKYGRKIKSFSEISNFDFIPQLKEYIKREIEGKSKDYILGVDEEEFKSYLIDKHKLESLAIDFNNEIVPPPLVTKEWVEDRFYREKYETDVYIFTVQYPFIGSADLFRVQPSSWIMTSAEITVDEHDSLVSFDFKLYKQDPEEFLQTKAEYKRKVFANLDSANQIAQGWMQSLPSLVDSLFSEQKNKYQKENDFFTAINVKVDPDTTSLFTAPTIKKKVIPQPIVSENKEFSSEPMMAKEMYNDILKVIYDLGKSMEKKPSTYKDKDEEGIRDQFLLVLETRYDATTASGETFNRGGKTDIILKYAPDASNLFVAECKFWHGASEFHSAISQLFDRYLTWRDSKVAILLFVQNKDFTKVLQTIKNEIGDHPYFRKHVGERGESSLSYEFCLPQDENKTVYLEVMAFHFDK
ncbi:hypothetical protein [Chryseobacterium foetidum]|uniref:hypothetical protein n=1 Tax=Chryseobacterium foetidum TaxID=2951057 RepID=UPI0021C88DE0|nr:hypothetical protein [Chryseobacterium foetidum]